DAFLNSQHIESQRLPRGIAWTQHVVGHRRLQIGTCEDAAKATEALRPKASVNPELEHGVPTNNDARLRGHSKDGVVADDRRECFKVSLLARIDDLLQQLALGAVGLLPGRPFGAPPGRPFGPPRWQPSLKRDARPLQGAVDRRGADIQEPSGFSGRPAQHVTQDERRPLLRREKLNDCEERDFDRFAAQHDRFRVGIVLRDRLDQGVWNRLKPRNLVGRRWSAVLLRLRGQNGPPFVAGDGIEADVGCHAVEPRTKWRSLYEALPIAPRAEKRVLQRILGVVEGAEHAIAVDQQLTTMAASEMVESLFVTSTNCRGQRCRLDRSRWDLSSAHGSAPCWRRRGRRCSISHTGIERGNHRELRNKGWPGRPAAEKT